MRMLRLLLVFALATSFNEKTFVCGTRPGTRSGADESSSDSDVDLTLRLARPDIVEQDLNLPPRPQLTHRASSSSAVRSPHRTTHEGKRHATEDPQQSLERRRRPRQRRGQTMFSMAHGWGEDPTSGAASTTSEEEEEERRAINVIQLAERIGTTPEHPWHPLKSPSVSPRLGQPTPLPLFRSRQSLHEQTAEAIEMSQGPIAADASTSARDHPLSLLLPPSLSSPLQTIPFLTSQSHSRPTNVQSLPISQVGEGEMQQQVISGPQNPRPPALHHHHHPPILRMAAPVFQIQLQQQQSSDPLPSQQGTPTPILQRPGFHGAQGRRPHPHPHHSFDDSSVWPSVPLHPSHPRHHHPRQVEHHHHRNQLGVHPSVHLSARHQPPPIASSSATLPSLGYRPWSPHLVAIGPARPSSLGHSTATTVVASSRNPLAGTHRTTDLQAAAAAAEAASSFRPASMTITRYPSGPQALASLPSSGFIHVPQQTPTAPRLSSPVLHGVYRVEDTPEQGTAVAHPNTSTSDHRAPEMLPVLHRDEHRYQQQMHPEVRQQQRPPSTMTFPMPKPLRTVPPSSPPFSNVASTPSRTAGPASWHETFPKLAAARVWRRGRPRSAIVHRDHFPHHHHPPPHHHDASTSGHRERFVLTQAVKEGQGSGHNLAMPKDTSSSPPHSPDTTSATKLTDVHRPASHSEELTTTTTTKSANAPATILPPQDLQKFDSTLAAVLSHFNAYNVDQSSTWKPPLITSETAPESSAAAPSSSRAKLGAEGASIPGGESLIHLDPGPHRGRPHSPGRVTPAGAVAQVARMLAQPAAASSPSSSPAERSRASTPTQTSVAAAPTAAEDNEEEDGEGGDDGEEGGATQGLSRKRKRATSISENDATKRLRLARGQSKGSISSKGAMPSTSSARALQPMSPSAFASVPVDRTGSPLLRNVLPEFSDADSEKTISWTYPPGSGSDDHDPGAHTSPTPLLNTSPSPRSRSRSRTKSPSNSSSPSGSRSRSRSSTRSSTKSESESNSESGWISVDVGGNDSSPRTSFGSSS